MNKGYFLLSHELLRELLYLPDDADIVAVDFHDIGKCKVWVEHSEIPEAREGYEWPELCPVIKRQEEESVFVEWGA